MNLGMSKNRVREQQAAYAAVGARQDHALVREAQLDPESRAIGDLDGRVVAVLSGGEVVHEARRRQLEVGLGPVNLARGDRDVLNQRSGRVLERHVCLARDLALPPGTRVYNREVKAAGLVLRKEITLEVEVTTPRFSPPKNAPPPGQTAEYILSMYIGGEFVMTSRKEERPVSLKLGLEPGHLPYGFKPDYVLHRNDPNPMNSFSIIQAIGMIYSLLKDLLKKRSKKDVEPPKIQTVSDLTLTFKQKDEYGRDQESKVSIRLRIKNLPYVLSVP